MSSVLTKKLEKRILTLTLNRPERLNALTWELMRLLKDALEEASANPDVRVVVLTGAGRAFCAGGNIRGAEQLDPDDPISKKWSADPVWSSFEMRTSQVQRFSGSSVLLHNMPKPTIASLRGAVAGAGLSLATACDFRIADSTAVFTTAFVKAARSGDFGGSYFLTRLVGAAKARELYLLGEKIDANEALRIGLINRVVPEGALEKETCDFASRLARGPAAAYRYIKRNLNAAETLSLEQVIELESYHIVRCGQTEDAREVIGAAREGRDPEFSGQ